MKNKVSVIVPVYNESGTIEGFQKELEKLDGNFEVLFVDGGSSDDTLEKIRSPYRAFFSESGRARQMNHGAKKASGNIFWFLHCDSRLPENALLRIEETMKHHRIGCFSLDFDSDRPLLKIIAKNSDRRVDYRNIAFGDQGIFMRKAFFEEMKGFPPLPIMEDYEFSMRVKEKGVNIVRVPEKIITSSRRFERNGVFKTMVNMQIWQHRYRKNRNDADAIAEEYGKGDS